MIGVCPQTSLPAQLRKEYLDLLPEPQELFVERQIAKGSVWSIRKDEQEIGYAVTDGGETLLELHLTACELRHLQEASDMLIQGSGIRRILAKSFDANLLFVALPRMRNIRTTGMLYRVVADAGFREDAAVKIRAANDDDMANLLDIGRDFFDGAAEVRSYRQSGGLLVYETGGGLLLGAGLLSQVVAGRDDIDIGMVVAPAHRRRGYGTYIVAHLKAHCLASRLRPICGCAVDNLASQRTLERAGFASRHKLMEFEL